MPLRIALTHRYCRHGNFDRLADSIAVNVVFVLPKRTFHILSNDFTHTNDISSNDGNGDCPNPKLVIEPPRQDEQIQQDTLKSNERHEIDIKVFLIRSHPSQTSSR